MPDTRPPLQGGYSSAQMTAHWLIVALVVLQWLTGEEMAEAFGRTVEAGEGWILNGGAVVHGLMGLTVLGLMIWRLALRRRVGAPPPPETEPEMVQKISRGVHFAFYAVLILMPLLGILAWVTGVAAFGELHEWSWLLLILLMLAHVGGAVWHVIKRDGVMSRMARSDPARMD